MADRHWSSEPASISSPLAGAKVTGIHICSSLQYPVVSEEEPAIQLGLDAVDEEPLLVNDEVPGAAEGQGQ